MFRRILLSALCLLLFSAGVLPAAVPGRISYQGHLTDNAGNPLTGSFDLTFRVYTDSVGGSSIYEETHTGVPVDSGLFAVLIGGKSFIIPFDDNLFSGPDRYLSIQVGADPEMAPRTRLVTSPYAFRTSTIDGATGGTVGGDVQVDGTVHSTSGGFQFPDNSVQTAAAQGVPVARTSWLSPYWLNNSGIIIYTFVAVYNPAGSSTTVTLTFYDDSGTQVGQCIQAVAANSVWSTGSSSAPTGACFTDDGIGHFTITATQPVDVWGAVYQFSEMTNLQMGASLTFYAP